MEEKGYYLLNGNNRKSVVHRKTGCAVATIYGDDELAQIVVDSFNKLDAIRNQNTNSCGVEGCLYE